MENQFPWSISLSDRNPSHWHAGILIVIHCHWLTNFWTQMQKGSITDQAWALHLQVWSHTPIPIYRIEVAIKGKQTLVIDTGKPNRRTDDVSHHSRGKTLRACQSWSTEVNQLTIQLLHYALINLTYLHFLAQLPWHFVWSIIDRMHDKDHYAKGGWEFASFHWSHTLPRQSWSLC